MGHYQPDIEQDSRRQAASHYYPLIGLYDSADPDVLDCQCLLMKLSGIDGVIIDWYGLDDHLDYAINHRNTLQMIEAIKRCGLKFAVCYEDSTLPGLISAGKVKESESVEHAREMIKWVDSHWFQDASYVKLDGRPLFLVFGNGYYQGDQWNQILNGIAPKPLLITEAHQRGGSVGAFDWPHPEGAGAGWEREMNLFYEQSKSWQQSVPVSFPRFHDIYEQAGVHKSWGEIPDDNGKTFEKTLEHALKSSANLVQIATWNDWGEGTQIEPSIEFGYRDLEAVQRIRRPSASPHRPYTANDLRLPIDLLMLEKRSSDGTKIELDKAKSLLMAGSTHEAGEILAALRGTAK